VEIGFYGLGRMGGNMVTRLVQGGHRVVASNRSSAPIDLAAQHGAEPAYSLEELVGKLKDTQKAVWIMVPEGKPVDDAIEHLTKLLKPGDIIIDGGNSWFKDTIRRAEALKAQGFNYMDCGTSGGVWGLKVGYSLMVGGAPDLFARLEPLFKTLAPENGYGLMGPNGAGHYVKMVHNGVEYGMMQSYGEGYEIMKNSQFDLNLLQITKVWNHGSVVRSWLLELAEIAFEAEGDLSSIRGYVQDSGEGRWTVLDAIEHSVPAPIITLSLLERFHSRQTESYSAKVLAALRNQFGGHAVKTEGQE